MPFTMHLLLIEDDELLADAIRRALEHASYKVDWTADGLQADNWLQERKYDLVILDLGLPGRDGGDLLVRLRHRKQRVPVLVVSARDALTERIRLLDIGADDYLVKPIALAELEARIRALTRRINEESEQTTFGNLRMDIPGQRCWVGDVSLDLTAHEWKLLSLLVSRANRIVGKEAILEAIYGWEDEASTNAVEKLVSRLRPKLTPSGVAIRTVRGLGYMIETP